MLCVKFDGNLLTYKHLAYFFVNTVYNFRQAVATITIWLWYDRRSTSVHATPSQHADVARSYNRTAVTTQLWVSE